MSVFLTDFCSHINIPPIMRSCYFIVYLHFFGFLRYDIIIFIHFQCCCRNTGCIAVLDNINIASVIIFLISFVTMINMAFLPGNDKFRIKKMIFLKRKSDDITFLYRIITTAMIEIFIEVSFMQEWKFSYLNLYNKINSKLNKCQTRSVKYPDVFCF